MTTETPSRPRPDSAPQRASGLAIAALVASFVVGPVGVVLGALALRRDGRTPARGRGMAIAAILIGALQTIALVVGGFVLAGQLRADPVGLVPSPSPTSTATGSAAPAPTDEVPGPSGTPIEIPPQLVDVVPPEVAGFTPSEFTDDPDVLASGADEAVTGTYDNGRFDIGVRASAWESPEAAEAFATGEAAAAFAPAELIQTGPANDGTYWYYVQNRVATLIWTDGSRVLQATGAENWVQEFFVQFPDQAGE